MSINVGKQERIRYSCAPIKSKYNNHPLHDSQRISRIKIFTSTLLTVMHQVIQVVNFIKTRSLQSRIFSQLCDAMDSDYKTLLYHTKVHWLSMGKVKRLVHLRVEVISFLEVEETSFGFSLHDELWWLKVQFLSNLFEKLNSLNLSLQGPSENIITSTSKLKAFE